MKKIFDIGMYDGADTAYYLESGYSVVSVEANVKLFDDVKRRFEPQIASGQLTCINAAISPHGESVNLTLCGQDLGASSVFSNRIAHRRPSGTVLVPGVTLNHIFEQYGVPEFLKVDIEGADRLCVLALTPDIRPRFLSFEVSDDVEELLSHVQSIGYKRFKIINQVFFRELSNQRCWSDLLVRRLIRYSGYSEPRMVRRAGRFFVCGHSSGPLPWYSDGRWRSAKDTYLRLRETKTSASRFGFWYDIYATID